MSLDGFRMQLAHYSESYWKKEFGLSRTQAKSWLFSEAVSYGDAMLFHRDDCLASLHVAATVEPLNWRLV